MLSCPRSQGEGNKTQTPCLSVCLSFSQKTHTKVSWARLWAATSL